MFYFSVTCHTLNFSYITIFFLEPKSSTVQGSSTKRQTGKTRDNKTNTECYSKTHPIIVLRLIFFFFLRVIQSVVVFFLCGCCDARNGHLLIFRVVGICWNTASFFLASRNSYQRFAKFVGKIERKQDTAPRDGNKNVLFFI